MSTIYTRSSDFVLFAASNRAAKMNVELDLISASIASLQVNPAFSGNATCVTQSVGNNTTLLANTAFVQAAIGAAGTMLPVQTGHGGPPTEWLKTNGTSASWAALPMQTYAIFNASTVTLTAVSALEAMENTLTATGLTTVCEIIAYSSGDALFVAAGGRAGSNANVASSADGLTWTLRAMPSSAAWCPATDGIEWVATVPGATTTAYSAAGTAWSSTTALPAAAMATYGLPVFQGTTCFVLSNTAGSAYTSSDYGTSWATQTLPANAGSMAPYVVGGLIWYYASGTTAYTSTTGATGSFTSRTLPATPSLVWQDFDGALWLVASGGAVFYRTTNGTSWDTMTLPMPTGALTARTINGVYAIFSTTFGSSMSMHDAVWVRRTSTVVDAGVSYYRCAKNSGGTVFLLPHGAGTTGQVGRIAPAEGSAANAIFST